MRFPTRHPWLVIVVWLALAGALSSVAAVKAADVINDDTGAFLPKSSESARATEFGRTAFGQVPGTSTVAIVVKPEDGGRLDGADRRDAAAVAAELTRWRPDLKAAEKASGAAAANERQRETRVVAAEAGAGAPDGRFGLVAVQFKGSTADPLIQEAYRQFHDHAEKAFAERDLRPGFTGGIATVVDIQDSTEDERGLEQLILFGSIVLLNLLFFRGILSAIVPLLTVFTVAGAAGGVVIGGAWLLDLELDVGTPSLITTVLMGVGIDYLLFLVFRFREELRAGRDRREAAARANRSVGHVIASAALAVAVAFATLGIAEFGQYRVLGPSIAVAVVVMLAAGVTLMPAVLAVTGRALFWPSKAWRRERTDGFAARLGRLVAHRPRTVALASVAVLAALAFAALGTKLTYDLSFDGKDMEATRVAAEIDRALPRGATDPQTVYVRADRALTQAELALLAERLRTVDRVEQVGEPVLTEDRKGAAMGVVLDAESTSKTGMDLAAGPLRDAAHAAAPEGAEIMVGGRAAVFADVADSIERDLRVIFPVAALLIGLILVLLLRSAIAPAYLLAAVGLEFAATLGASVLVFGNVAFTLPLVLFLFVVALGTDYNMLVSARMREEMLAGRDVRDAVAEAVRRTAPAIAAAGLVLATSFGSLALYPDEGMRQTGFAMAVGILIASLVVSTLLVPAITALVGRRAFRAAVPEPHEHRLAA
jgi:RND superfamily putative drug exporter